MKKVISAWIEQFIEFDSEMEYLVFHHELKNGKKKYKIVSDEKLTDGKFKVHVIRQYNNNAFPKEVGKCLMKD